MLKDKKILIVDDLVRTGNTIGECAIQCREYGAKDVIVFVPHAVFPNDDFVKFQPGKADRFSNAVSRFYTTSSVPHVSRKLDRQKFTVFDFAKIVANSKYF
jgi:phosphoribosylpyrophosphate synthetase